MKFIHNINDIPEIKEIKAVHVLVAAKNLEALETMEECPAKALDAPERVNWVRKILVSKKPALLHYITGHESYRYYKQYVLMPVLDQVYGDPLIDPESKSKIDLMIKAAHKYFNGNVAEYGNISIPTTKAYSLVNNEFLIPDGLIIASISAKEPPRDTLLRGDLFDEPTPHREKVKVEAEELPISESTSTEDKRLSLEELNAAILETENKLRDLNIARDTLLVGMPDCTPVQVIVCPKLLSKLFSKAEIKGSRGAFVQVLKNKEEFSTLLEKAHGGSYRQNPVECLNLRVIPLTTQRFKPNATVQQLKYGGNYLSNLPRILDRDYGVLVKADDLSDYKFSSLGDYIVPDFIIAAALGLKVGDKV